MNHIDAVVELRDHKISRLDHGRKISERTEVERGKALDDHWLQEAASVFNVATNYKKLKSDGSEKTMHKMPREQIVDAVVSAVRKARGQMTQPASARDAARLGTAYCGLARDGRRASVRERVKV